ncbi:MAG: hypothetical protein HY042_13035 [Spirochaetia bacterium]|nr:hypothetical protein [Spirochaetia bacterium]
MEKMTAALDRIMKLTEQELANAEEIIRMYEAITEGLRQELVAAKDTLAASESVSSLSREEMKNALGRIKMLEGENQKLRARKADMQS